MFLLVTMHYSPIPAKFRRKLKLNVSCPDGTCPRQAHLMRTEPDDLVKIRMDN